MNHEQIITYLFNSVEANRVLLRYAGRGKYVFEELRSESLLVILSKDEKYLIERHQNGTLLPLYYRIAYRLMYGTRSRFRRITTTSTTVLPECLNMAEDNNNDEELLHTALDEEILKLHERDRHTIHSLMQCGTVKGAAKKLNEPYPNVAYRVRRIKNRLKTLIEKNLKQNDNKVQELQN